MYILFGWDCKDVNQRIMHNRSLWLVKELKLQRLIDIKDSILDMYETIS